MAAVTFNNKPLPSFVKLVGREISVLPDLSVKYQELPTQIGGSYLRTEKGVKKESLDFILIPEQLYDVDSAAREFSDWLRGNDFNPSLIWFDTEDGELPAIYYMAQVNGSVSVSDLFTHGELSVEFIYVDPLGTGTVTNTLSSDSYVSSLVVNYKGTAPALPSIISVRFIGNASRLVIYANSDSDKKLTLVGQFKAGDLLLINSLTRSIRLNNVTNMNLLSVDSQWFNITPQTTRIYFGGTGITSSTISSMSVVYQDKYY